MDLRRRCIRQIFDIASTKRLFCQIQSFCGGAKMSTLDSKAPLRTVKRVQFGIISPDEIVSKSL